MSAIDAAIDSRDLRKLKGFRFEKPKGRPGERSLRLNKQWRLIVALEKDSKGNYLLIIDIEDYH